ncbi:choloylglycine hydrolase family protein [Pediococcus pentosaceus]|uniref:choloylglycine hydrolase family protein n=1 Tax=Pediococcus pentosaceus TaxID=1255 RepID=UPI003982B6BD
MCTGIRITATGGEVFWGRTMDLGLSFFKNSLEQPFVLPTTITTIPRGWKMSSQLVPWSAKYSVMGMGVRSSTMLFDGVNEKGLAGDLQVLPEATAASLSEIQEQGLKPMLGLEFLTYILTTYQSVQEIRDHYREYALVDQPFKFAGQTFEFPLHYTFTDAGGASVVLEPVDHGAFKLYESVGVVTNGPEYDWHRTNLRNYIHVADKESVQPLVLNKQVTVEPIEFGVGYGMVGLPGDYTSTSRFVRAFYVANSLAPFTRAEGIGQLYGAFKSVTVPRGLELAKQPGQYDYTQYWAGYDLTERTLYVQNCDELALHKLTLNPEITDLVYTDLNQADPI